LWAGPAICFAVAAYNIWVLHKARQSDAPWLHGITASSVFLLIGYGLLLLRTANWLRPTAFGVAAVLVIAIDMVTYAHGYLPFAYPSEIYPRAPLIEFLKQHSPGDGRIANLDGTYGPNFEMMYGLASVGGYDIGLRVIKRFLEGVSYDSLDDVSLSAEKIAGSHDRRLDMLNARYFLTTTYNTSYDALAARPDRFSMVFADRTVRVFENRLALPRAFFVPLSDQSVEVLDDDAQLRRVKDPSFDPQKTVVVDSSAPLPARKAPTIDSAPPRVEVVRVSSNSIELRVDLATPGILVLSQIFYPGWHANAGGHDLPVFKVNYALTGVALDAGVQSVRFVYRPMSYKLGAIVTMLSIGVAALLAIFYRKPRLAQAD